jgi:SAM-dependent methyltransferase
MSLNENLGAMELARENYWNSHPQSAKFKLRWRATTVRHCFHVLPGERILEIGAGSGLWTRHLSSILGKTNPITAAYFNERFSDSDWPELPGVTAVHVQSLDKLPAESFDYVVGTSIICHDQYPLNLKAIYRLLKPGGQILFFENNLLNPQVFLKTMVRPIGRLAGNAACQVGMNKFEFLRIASHQGFVDIDVIPYDIVHISTPGWLIHSLQAIAFIFEQAPVVRDLCGTLYLWARKPGGSVKRAFVNLATVPDLYKSVSFVVPCHNEEMNVGPLVDAILGYYGDYVHEILIVNDNSRDRTGAVTRELALADSRVKLIDRSPPNGVGRALRDGYAAATGHYILTMDSDFVQIVPELKDLFEAIAEGYEGAIGSRFTHESVMVNYPFPKIMCNRIFHLLVNLVLPCRVHDVSNNLKLFRSQILKDIPIKEDHFAANAETGLKPIVSGYRIKEVPISWINRTIDMGTSSFKILRVGPNYLLALWDVIRSSRELARRSDVRVARASAAGTERR